MKRFFDLYLNAFRNYANFSGRACRAEAIAFMWTNWLLMYYIPAIIAKQMHIVEQGKNAMVAFGGVSALYVTILFLIIAIPTLALSVRRLHDINLSGWVILLALIAEILLSIIFIVIAPVIKIIFVILTFVVLYVVKGDDYANLYGEPSSKY